MLCHHKKSEPQKRLALFCHTDISVYGAAYVLKTKQLLFLCIKFFLGDDAAVKEIF